MIANALIYSRFRYWVYCMVIPDYINAWIEADVHALIWCSDFSPHPDEEGTEALYRPFMRWGASLLNKRQLGLGTLHWQAHIKAIQAEIMLKYLSGTTSKWKLVLDQWFARYPEERGAVFSLMNTTWLTKSLTNRPTALPNIFKQALKPWLPTA